MPISLTSATAATKDIIMMEPTVNLVLPTVLIVRVLLITVLPARTLMLFCQVAARPVFMDTMELETHAAHVLIDVQPALPIPTALAAKTSIQISQQTVLNVSRDTRKM
jgi:hypothetical protein